MKRYMIRSQRMSGEFWLDTDHAPMAFCLAGLGLYVFDRVAHQQIVSNDPRVEHFVPVDPRRAS